MGRSTETIGPVRLTLVCHASTAAVRTAAFPSDEPLDAGGLAAAAELASRLPAVRTVFSSPARRALETAAAAGLTAQPVSALRDCDFGRWAGRTLDEIAAEAPDAVAQWLAEPQAAPHGGETVAAVLQRVAEWMDSPALEGRTLAITHPSVIRAAVLHAVGAPAQSFWRIDAAPLSMIELRRNERRWSLHAI